MLESGFKKKFLDNLEIRFPGIVIVQTDPTNFLSFPDIILLYGNRWAALETKRNTKARKQPNQPHWIRELNDMSYASFLSPENQQEVLDELEQLFGL